MPAVVNFVRKKSVDKFYVNGRNVAFALSFLLLRVILPMCNTNIIRFHSDIKIVAAKAFYYFVAVLRFHTTPLARDTFKS